ncbi:inner nuclear membrane protein [Artemisia annua]|uniref:Inner nuclear membrane protein n=1 Tax=Artemisia annua TaxID=35608 RepID=A0A2U1MS09_ARTAN|nr:inner nuclear membrane protein [Artemisia annua]
MAPPSSSLSTPKPKKRRIKNPSNIPILSSIEPPPTLLPSKADLLRAVAVLSVAISVAIGCNLVVKLFNRQPKPFCNSNHDDEFDYHLSDGCDPCPSHGICNEGKLECMSGYVRHGRSCLEDGDINEMAKNLAKMVESHACESYSQYLCKGVGKVWVQGDELWNNMDENNTTYLYAKEKAVEIVGNLLETRDTSVGIKKLKCPDLLVEHYKPLSCSIRLWLLEHAVFLVPVCALLIGCGLMLQKIRRRQYLSVRSEELYEQVCEMLEENALTSRSVDGEGEPWIVASWLRDHILTPKERRDPLLWKKVEDLVQEDSRLDRYPKILKGDPKVVWEWQVEGSLRSAGKKKKGEINKQKMRENPNLGFNQDHGRLKLGEPFKC